MLSLKFNICQNRHEINALRIECWNVEYVDTLMMENNPDNTDTN